jgi:hypothetical protein
MLIMYWLEFFHLELLIDMLYQVILQKQVKMFQQLDQDVDRRYELN